MNIIPEKEYFKFLDKKGKNCIFQSYKNIYTLKDNYPKTNSNNQINFLITEIYKNKNINYLNKFMILLTSFISFNDSFKLLDLIKDNNLNDTDVMNYVEKAKKVDSVYSIGETCGREQFGMEFIKMQFKKDNSNLKYLDIGCGDGRKTITFSKVFNIDIKNVKGTDIEIWGPYKKNKKFDFDFKFILKNGKLDYDDNSFDIITCFLTLHHIKDLDNMINEINRILKKNGKLIIIEHDSLNFYDDLIIDIQHLFFAFLYDKNKNYIKNPLYSNYLNRMEFEFMFKKKFKLIKSENYYKTIDMQKRYDQQFYQIYKVIK